MKIVIDGIIEDYVQVVGFTKNKSKSTGKPFGLLSCVVSSFGENSLGYNVDTKFVTEDFMDKYNVAIGDQVCILSVQNGSFAKVVDVKVIKSDNPFDKKATK